MTVGELLNTVGFRVSDKDVANVNQAISNIKNTASRVLGAIGIGFSLAAVNQLTEEFTRVKQQIRNSISDLGVEAEIQDKILHAATETRSAYEQTAGVISDLVKGNSELFGTIDQAIAFHNAATKLFKTAGKSNEQIAGLMEAINKSFQKGYVDSETLSQLLENSPEAVEILNKHLGSTSDQLEKMAQDGKFTVKDLRDAFVSNADSINKSFRNVQITITEALTVIRNKWGLFISETNEMFGITDKIGAVIVKISDYALGFLKKARDGLNVIVGSVGGLENLLRLVAFSAGAVYTAFNFTKIRDGLKAIKKLLTGIEAKTLATTAKWMLLGLVAADFVSFMLGKESFLGRILEKAGIDCDVFREKIITTFWNIVNFVRPLWEGVVAGVQEISHKLVEFWDKYGEKLLSGAGKALSTIGKVIYNFVSAITGAKSAEEVMYSIGKAASYLLTTFLAFKSVKKFFSFFGIFGKIFSFISKLTQSTGTASAALGAMGDAAVSTAGSTSREFGGMLGKVMQTGGVFSAVAAKVHILFDAIKKRWPVLTTLKSLLPGLSASVSKFVGSFSRSWGSLISRIKSSNSVNQFVRGLVKDILWNFKELHPAMSGIVDKCLSLVEKIYRSGGLGNFIYIQMQQMGVKGKTALKGIFSGLGAKILPLLQKAFGGAGPIITKVIGPIKSAISAFKGLLSGSKALSAIGAFISSPVGIAVAAIVGLIAVVVLLIKNWDTVKQKTSEVWTAIQEFFANILAPYSDFIAFLQEWGRMIKDYWADVWNKLKEKAREIWRNIIDGICQWVDEVYNNIVNGVQKAIDWLTGLPARALQWGKDLIQNFVNGIKEKLGLVTDAAEEVADEVSSYLHFTEPDVGPLSNFHTFMPDMIALMVKGMNEGRTRVRAAASAVASEMRSALQVDDSVVPTLNGKVAYNAQFQGDAPDSEIRYKVSLDDTGTRNLLITLNEFVSTTKNLVGYIAENFQGWPIKEAMEDLAYLADYAYVHGNTARNVTNSSVKKNVVMNVDISNQFNGDTAIQKNASNAMRQSTNDLTSELARGLAFAR